MGLGGAPGSIVAMGLDQFREGVGTELQTCGLGKRLYLCDAVIGLWISTLILTFHVNLSYLKIF